MEIQQSHGVGCRRFRQDLLDNHQSSTWRDRLPATAEDLAGGRVIPVVENLRQHVHVTIAWDVVEEASAHDCRSFTDARRTKRRRRFRDT